MKYDHFDMLPEDAFKPEFKKLKVYGGGKGGGSAPAPAPQFNLYSDPGYRKSQKYLDTLRPMMERNNQPLTPEQILAQLTPEQRSIIDTQKTMPMTPDMSSWGNFNSIAPVETRTQIIPMAAPTAPAQAQFDPALVSQLANIISSSSYLAKGRK